MSDDRIFTFKILNQQQFLLSFETLGQGLRNFSFLWPALAQHFYEVVKQTFASAGRATSWPALSTAYGKYKAAKYPGKPILQREELLIASLTERGARYSIYAEGPLTLQLGTSRPGATAHQTGSGRLPARPPIDFTVADYREFAKIIQGGLETIAKAAGFRPARLAA